MELNFVAFETTVLIRCTVREMVISMDFYPFVCIQPYTLFPIGPIICSLVCRELVAPNRTPNQFGEDINDN